jgi:hypothetical protein
MTDRELLELAAKAIGLPECGWMGPAFMYVKDNTFTDWNPLENDGDALRLAVKLKISVLRDFDRVIACYGDDEHEFETEFLYEKPTPTDPYAATRRAITRAAAEIGKTLDK